MAALTEEQSLCVDALEGPVDISAGAGSGKTYTLTRRIAEALKNPASEVESIDQILAITFTNKAAGELKGRVRAVLRATGLLQDALKVDAAWISTVHGMCARILRECALDLGIDPAFKVIEDRECAGLLAESIGETIGTTNDFVPRDEYCELFDAYKVGSAQAGGNSNNNGTTIASMITKILNETAGMIDGFSSIKRGPDPRKPSTLARELLVAYENVIGLCDHQNQSTTMVANAEKMQTAIDRLNEYLESGDQNMYAFCLLLDDFKMPTRTAGNVDFKQQIAGLNERAAMIIREAAFGYGSKLLDQVIVLAEKVQHVYDAKKRHAGYLDNNDLMKLTYRALEIPAIAERYTSKFKLVMVDEFQDTDRLQIAIAKKLSGQNLQYLCTVGDAQQSIYAFRGADIEAYHAYRHTLQAQSDQGQQRAQFLKLTRNFRSHSDVLAFVKHVCAQPQVFGGSFLDLSAGYGGEAYLSNEPRIKLAAVMQPPNSKDNTVASLDMTELAAQGIADHFEQMHAAGHSLSEMVILLRSMAKAETYAQAIRDKGFPCVISGGSVFARAPEVKLVGYLARVIANREDGEALVKVLSSEMILLSADDMVQLSSAALGSRDQSRFRSLSRGLAELGKAGDFPLSPALRNALGVFENMSSRVRYEPLSQCVLQAIEESGWMARLEANGPEGLAVIGNIFKAVRFIEQFEQDQHYGPSQAAREFCNFLESAKEAPGALALQGQDAVWIMSIHASKGLEFPLVALAELEKLRAFGASSKFMAKAIGDNVFLSLMPGSNIFDEKGAVVQAAKNAPAFSEAEGDDQTALCMSTNLDIYGNLLASYRKKQEASEAQRLFYVAATRAKESLYISVTIKEQSGTPLNAYRGTHEDLRSALFGEEAFSHDDQEIPFGGTQPLEYTYICAVDDREAPPEEAHGNTAGQLGTYMVPTVQPYAGMQATHTLEKEPSGLHSYSSLSAEAPVSQHRHEEVTLPADADKATDFGSAFHRLAQLAALRSAEQARAHLEALARTYNIADQQRLTRAFENWLASQTFQEAMAYDNHVPEVPFCIPLGSEYLEGEIDLLCYNQGDDQAFVVDYKTGGQTGETLEALQDKHRFQAQCYAYALLVSGFNRVDLVFARVEQGQTVTYTYIKDDQQTLEEIIKTHLS